MPPRKMPLERAISYIQEDELVEITPKAIRLRKKILDSALRAKMRKQSKSMRRSRCSFSIS
jgi:GTP-binding protein